MKVKAVEGWICPSCDEKQLVEDEPLPEIQIFYQCGKCEEVYTDKAEAKECCKE